MNGDEDIFMLQYLESIFTNGVSKIKIMLTGIPDKDSFFEKRIEKNGKYLPVENKNHSIFLDRNKIQLQNRPFVYELPNLY